MRRALFPSLTVLMILGMVLTACGGGAVETVVVTEVVEGEPVEVVITATPEPMEEEETIQIGVSLPLTGSFSIPGTKHEDGYQLCVDLINQGGGLLDRPVELLVTDNQSDAEVAIAQFERFINQDQVDLIFGTFSSLITFPASSVTEQAQMVHPIPSAAALRIYERGYEYLFYFQPNAAEFIGQTPIDMINDLVEEGERPESAALVWADDFFANAIAAGLLGQELEIEGGETIDMSPGQLVEADLEVVYQEQWPEQGFSDWNTLASSIRASEADMLFALVTSPDEAIQLVRAMQTVDYQPMGVFMSQGAQSEFAEELGPAANGITIHASWHQLANFTGMLNGEEFTNQDFQEAFQAKFGRAADEDEAIPFAVCQGMEQAVRATGTTDNTEMREWLAARTAEEPVRTVLGDFYWDERGLPVGKPFIMVQWQDENLEFVYPKGAFPGVEELTWPKPAW